MAPISACGFAPTAARDVRKIVDRARSRQSLGRLLAFFAWSVGRLTAFLESASPIARHAEITPQDRGPRGPPRRSRCRDQTRNRGSRICRRRMRVALVSNRRGPRPAERGGQETESGVKGFDLIVRGIGTFAFHRKVIPDFVNVGPGASGETIRLHRCFRLASYRARPWA